MTMAHSSVKVQSTKRAVAQTVFFLVIIRSAMSESHNISFNYTSSQLNHPNITFQGNATSRNLVMELSTVQPGESGVEIVGRALYHQAMHLWDSSTGNVADFTSRFTFIINSDTTIYADGVAFFLAPDGSQIPEGSKGGSLGLTNSTNSSLAFVAVEFDTFFNPELMDPDCCHVGIDVNTMVSVRHVCVPWANYSILNGKQLHAQVTLNSTEKNLSVVFGDSFNHSTSLHYHLANLTENLPEWVNFGFSAATGANFESHTILSWEFSSTLQVLDTPTGGTTQSKKSKSWVWAISGVGSFFLVLLVAGFGWCCYTTRRESDDPNGEEDANQSIDEGFEQSKGPKKYSYRVLTMATNNFASAQLLGEGGFGRVYEGQLADVNVRVAIKKITPESKQGLKEYATEVKTIRFLRHKNLVELIGWCHERNEFLLVYEFMSNGSLDSHLFKGKAPLTWEKRYNIAKGIALGLKYLHEDLKQCVVHRDIKTSNVLLDSEFTAKLGDFGMARIVDHAKGSQTTLLAGTMGYLAPECIYTGKASKESDIYSFGVVLLEIACGRKVIESRAAEDQVRLVMWVWELYGVGKLMDAVDPKLGKDFDVRQMECLMITGLWCAHPDPMERPPISRVISFLNLDTLPPVLPSKLPVPTYVAPPSIPLELLPTLSSSKSCSSSSALLSIDE